MAKLKISELPAATSVASSDLLYLVQGNTSKSISVGTLLSRITGNVTFTGKITANIIQLPSYTSDQANTIGAANGVIIYNSQTNKIQGFAGMWIDLH
jgi:hypothetical protein